MTPDEYSKYLATNQPMDPTVSIGEVGRHKRTLVFGYDIERATVHVYMLDDLIHLHVYRPGLGERRPQTLRYDAKETWLAQDLRPSKRAYIDPTDYAFALLMRSKHTDLTFTNGGLGENTLDRFERTGFYGLLGDS